MSNLIVSDADVQNSKQWLFDNAPKIGKAKAEMELAGEKKKIIEAQVFLEEAGSVKERESKAKTSNRYISVIEDMGKKINTYHALMATKSAHENNIQVWQTQSANVRGLK